MIDSALTRKFVSLNVGHRYSLDNSRSINALGLEYSPVDQAYKEMFQQMIDTGIVTKV